jgi:Tfp pilus assembly protein PilZ
MGEWRQANTDPQRFSRVTTALPVRVSTVEPEIDPATGQRFFRSAEETTANLSHGGAFLRSWEPLSAGQRVILAIDLPRDGEVQLEARVAWTLRELRPSDSRNLEAPGYGVEFIDKSSHELACLDRYLKSLEPNPTTAIDQSGPTPTPRV